MGKAPAEAKLKKKDINPFSLIFGAIFVMYVLSFIIPSGSYERIDGIINPNNFSFIDKIYLWPWDLIRNIGHSSAQQFGTLWVNIFATGGTIALLTETGILDRTINALVRKLQNKVLLLIPAFVIFMFFTGTVGAFINSALALLPIGIIIAKKLRVDNVFAFGIIFLSSWSGLWFSSVDPVGMGLAQRIAGISEFSGLAYRLAFSVIAFLIIAAYLTLYAWRVRKDPTNSSMDEITLSQFEESKDTAPFNWKDLVVTFIFVGGIVFFGLGAALLGYSTSEFTGVMLVISLLTAIILRMNVATAMGYFAKGAGSMIVPVLILIFSQSLSIILSGTQIVDTMIFYLSKPLGALGGIFASLGMFGINGIINMIIYPFVPQIALVMPIMAPLADAVDMTRQTAVLSVQYGAGITDFITPFNGVLLAGLVIVRASFREWIRFVWPLIAILCGVMIVSLIIAGLIGFS